MSKKARIKCVTYGGRLGWIIRKKFSPLTSWAYLWAQQIIRKNLFKDYIRYFNRESENGNIPLPCLISIETVNRCNSTCSFCPANKYSDKRPFMKMSEELFKKIISELEEWEYDGYLNLYVNNEPFIDDRIEDWYSYAQSHLPKAKMLLYTNGTLMTKERFEKIAPHIDKMVINNYSERLKLHDNLMEVYELVKNNPKYYDLDITIQIRYINEVLTNRAGEAPNKKKAKSVNNLCIMPYTDFTIFPDGTVGLCCNDAREKTNLGNVLNSELMEIWKSTHYSELRKAIGTSRELYDFCKGCDFVDAGIRNMFMKTKLEGKN